MTKFYENAMFQMQKFQIRCQNASLKRIFFTTPIIYCWAKNMSLKFWEELGLLLNITLIGVMILKCVCAFMREKNNNNTK